MNGSGVNYSNNSKNLSEFSQEIQKLCQKSLEARKSAYAPYSSFLVGAALLSQNGKLITGCNVENASYGLSICAERTACVKALSEGESEFSTVAIAADLKGEFVPPCGACRQFLSEFNPNMVIYLVRVEDEQVCQTNLNFLMPESFSPKTFNMKSICK